MPIYVTKYALTKGILYFPEVILLIGERNSSTTTAFVKDATGVQHDYTGLEWWTTKEDALARAEQMRKRKVDRLSKELERLTDYKVQIVPQ